MSKNDITISVPPNEMARFQKWIKTKTTYTRDKCRQLVVKHTTDLHRRAKVSASTVFAYRTVKTKKGFKSGGSGHSHGFLKGQIKMLYSNNGMLGVVYSNVEYAPYQEFGTGRYAPIGILPGYESFARQFKGRGIRQVNIYPKMYLYPHYERIKKSFANDLVRLGYKKT